GVVVFVGVVFFAWRRHWLSLVTFVVAVPGGMLLNEWVKILVHRPRPFAAGPFVDWAGYSFASGHTIGATLLYGQIALFLVPTIKSRRGRALMFSVAGFVIVMVGFSRIALGAHYFTDVVGGMLLGTMWLTVCAVAARPLRRSTVPPILASVLPEPEMALVAIPVNETSLGLVEATTKSSL